MRLTRENLPPSEASLATGLALAREGDTVSAPLSNDLLRACQSDSFTWCYAYPFGAVLTSPLARIGAGAAWAADSASAT